MLRIRINLVTVLVGVYCQFSHICIKIPRVKCLNWLGNQSLEGRVLEFKTALSGVKTYFYTQDGRDLELHCADANFCSTSH